MRFLFCLLLLSTAANADRSDRDAAAKEAFRNLNFYSQGHGMMLSPGLISLYNLVTAGGHVTPGPIRNTLVERWGLVLNDQDRVAGLFEEKSSGHHIGVVGCVACHSGRAAGQYIVGLGNKTIDVVQLASDVHHLEQIWKNLTPVKSTSYRELEEHAMSFSDYLSNRDVGNLSQGLVPVSFIRGWFYRIRNQSLPADMTRGQVKVPFLWGYEYKRRVGQFCDGYGNGVNPGWAVAVELAAGQTPEAVRAYFPSVQSAELLFNDFLPPRYPFAIDSNRAAQGEQLFNQTCAGCHGTYERDSSGLPVFKEPRFIPWQVVRTDHDRLAGNTAAFNQMVETSPLSDLIQHQALGDGYFAPRLNGVWSRFPYLHNGSVPNIRALLTPPGQRPHLFSLRDAGERTRFDERALGLTQSANDETKLDPNSRQVYNVDLDGHSNEGHDFFTNLSAEQIRTLIEYLKTL